MRRKLTWAPVLVGGVAAAMLALACSSDEETPRTADGGTGGVDGGGGSGTGGSGTGGSGTGGSGTGGSKTDGGGTGGSKTDGGGTDGGSTLALCAGKTGTDQINCGQYLVQHIDACADCHSPLGPTGIDSTKLLAGNPSFADIAPTVASVGNIPTPNLTTLKSNGWTKADIKDAILNGKRSPARGGGLFPIMPYATFHNMASEDADAIVAYIYQLSPIVNDIPDREPLPGNIAANLPAPPFDATKIPDSTLKPTDAHYAEAQLGKYIASELGVCMECHTERTPQGALDATKLFAGGEVFHIGGPFGDVTSLNITPDDSGIKGWTAADVQTLILTGKDNMGVGICPPMPAGPNGAFGGMKPEQALAIGYYLTTIPPVSNHPADAGAFKMCVPPGPPPDGGTPDASTSDASTPTDAATKG